ncbi:phosphoribosylglycinamide formyltransferase [Ferroplasma acidarmanus]|uniref:phosphoribosylglycinamide formyltransferase 1 n=1 Tax=Ferroplasma acidarmanus Fer1 TaxID=333146 RepID=S0APZ0_FERAC|nr:phosphoribosylglycinamide formyltransferase [Ferroplasma acidarmanus]AGO60792.1 phosphoribosylglycinamide formyltransferase [Ferroplasma acidarmanus Fer1]
MYNIVVLASGNGSNFQAVVDAIDNGVINDAKISKLICNNKRAYVLQRARDSGIMPVLVDSKKEDYNNIISEILAAENPDLILLDGYMKIIPDNIIDAYPFKMINLHPSLLPAFGGKGYYGGKVHEAVIKSGARFSGCTIHFATKDVDNGPIIDQRVVEVSDIDTPESLEEKIHEEEHKSLVYSINLLITKRYSINGKRVIRE